MTGQARAAASRRRAGDGVATIRSAPTLIVSVPPAARPWLRLSTMSARALARRHSRRRLSARVWSSSTLWPASLPAATAITIMRRQKRVVCPLHIDQHPAAGEDGERPGPVEDQDLYPAEQIEIDIRDPGDDLHEDDASDQPKYDPGGACRACGDREEHGVSNEDRQREADGQRYRVSLQPGGDCGAPGGEHRTRRQRKDGCGEQYRPGTEPQQDIAPARHWKGERVHVAPAMIRRPGSDRDEQAQRGGEHGVQRPP